MKHRLLKKVAIIVAAVILVFLGLIFILSASWKPTLSEKIKAGVYNGSNHLYKIDFKNISLNLITGSASLNYVTLTPDTLVYHKLKEQGLAPSSLFEIKLNRIQISGVSILKAYFKKKIDVNAIVLNKPSINLIFSKVNQGDTAKKSKSLYDQVSKMFKSIWVKTILIKDADFDFINKSKPAVSKNSIKHLNITVNDFLLDSLSQADTTRFYLTKDISFELAGYSSISKDKMYVMKIDTVKGSTKSKGLWIKNLKLIPQYKQLDFARKYKVQKDRYDLSFEDIKFSEVDFLGLSSDQKFYAKSLNIGPAKVAVFMSRESPAPANLDKGRNYPHMALKRLNIETTIDTIKLKQVDVQYAEYNPASKKIGSVDFKSLSGKIYNVTNDSLRLRKNNLALADLNTLLMGSGKLNVKIDFNLTAKDGAFSYSGNMGAFNLKQLNPLSKALGLVEIEQGNVQQIDFKAKGNLRQASGNMSMLYSGLKIKLLSDNIDGSGTKEKGFLSFLANTVLVKDDNPQKGEAARTASMLNSRINSASFFNLMWKTVFIGIKDIVGVAAVPSKDPVKQQKEIAQKIKAQKKIDVKQAKSKN